MRISRRTFLKMSGATATGTLLAGLGVDLLRPKAASAKPMKIKYAKESYTICPYCGVGCAEIISVKDGKIINIEGDPDHPVNRGSLCSKGAALSQVSNNERRLSKVLYRAPYSDKWEEKTWDWALDKIARNAKDTRDKNWVTKDKNGYTVNRTEGIAGLGGAALDNEECYMYSKFARLMGIVYLEHQARICHSSTVGALAESFGRGAMTNHWCDIANSDAIIIIGSNAAEQHPLSFKWVTKAMDNGATLISIDPRFTRSSSRADIYAPMRSGTDVAMIGGIINYALQNDLYNREYVAEYTNAAHLINPGFKFDDGLFSGYDSNKRGYDKSTWTYQMDDQGIPKEDKTLKDPNCVFQLLKKHFSRYDFKTVSEVTGCPEDTYLEICKAYCATGAPDKSGTIMYAMGTTQHTNAVQMIRSYAILQLLLGNIGVAGGGINALRGESNVQGSTDNCILYHIFPGYLKTPRAEDKDLAAYLKHWTPVSKDPKSVNYWKNTPKFWISQSKAWFGDNATQANDFGYDWLPKMSGNYSHIALFEAMYDGIIKGLFCFGQNPAVSGPNLNKERKALGNLDWMVAVDIWETETANFWKRPGVDPTKIKTEVFMLPAAASFEKQGSITNSGRWAQWRYKAVDAPGVGKEDLWILNAIFTRVRDLYNKEGGTFKEPIVNAAWDYGEEPSAEQVAKEINGYDLTNGTLLANFTKLKDDGSTSCGNWLYSGSFTEDGNMMARRGQEDPTGIGLFPNYSWCWPVNRRILYNRASCDTKGKPWAEKKYVIKWTGSEWVGDVPDYGKTSAPEKNVGAFIMKPEGHARLFGPGLADGPFPEHYEPLESPVKNRFSNTQNDPAIILWKGEMNTVGTPDKFPIVATTFRVTEHWQAGAMTRNLPWLVELMPNVFVEMSKTLAKEKGVKNGDKVIVSSARGEIECFALVTDRFQTFKLNGKMVEEVGIVWHFGYHGLATGDSANILTPHVGDANTTIPEYKAFLCDVRKA